MAWSSVEAGWAEKLDLRRSCAGGRVVLDGRGLNDRGQAACCWCCEGLDGAEKSLASKGRLGGL